MKKEKLHEAMVNFQLLEFMLRGALEKYEQLIRDQVKEYFEYPYDQKAIDKMALGKLADLYSKYTDNKAFKAQVDLIITARNKLAHAMFVKVEHFDDELGIDLDNEIDEIYKASEMADGLASDVFEQTQHLYFDPFENKWVRLK